jgi:hypothetical protein
MNDEKIKEVLKTIIVKYLNKQITKEQVIEDLLHNIDCEVIYGINDLLVSDSYFTLNHILEENISNIELEYLLECLSELREYNLDEKLKLQQ